MITYLSYVGATLLIMAVFFFGIIAVGTIGDKIEGYFGEDSGEFAKVVYYLTLLGIVAGSVLYLVDYIGGKL